MNEEESHLSARVCKEAGVFFWKGNKSMGGNRIKILIIEIGINFCLRR